MSGYTWPMKNKDLECSVSSYFLGFKQDFFCLIISLLLLMKSKECLILVLGSIPLVLNWGEDHQHLVQAGYCLSSLGIRSKLLLDWDKESIDIDSLHLLSLLLHTGLRNVLFTFWGAEVKGLGTDLNINQLFIYNGATFFFIKLYSTVFTSSSALLFSWPPVLYWVAWTAQIMRVITGIELLEHKREQLDWSENRRSRGRIIYNRLSTYMWMSYARAWTLEKNKN